MFHLIPPSLHRLALRFAHWLRKHWWRIARPQLVGAVVIARNEEGALLLVRHSYGRGMWTLPGGGLKRGELPAAAARREMAEELSCGIEALTPLTVIKRTLHGAPNVTHVYIGDIDGAPMADGREIDEARFFAPDALPQFRTTMVDASLARLEKR